MLCFSDFSNILTQIEILLYTFVFGLGMLVPSCKNPSVPGKYMDKISELVKTLN